MRRYFLFVIALVLFGALSHIAICSDNKASYLIPDIGAPGMNVYIEIVAHTDSILAFGADGIKDYSSNSQWQLKPANSSDEWKIIFGPLVVSWNGRLISTQAFIHPELAPTSWKWNEGIKIPIVLLENGTVVNTFNFYVVNPCPLGDISKITSPKENLGGEEVIVLGKAPFGLRSPRGAMLVDSLILADNTKYVVSTEDCDLETEGNQAYLPFVLLSLGDIRGGSGTVISVDGLRQDAGVGGGGGGGAFCDNLGLASDSPEVQRGGNGYTGGGIGGVNNSGIFSSSYYASNGGGIGSGSIDSSATKDFAGKSLNGLKGATKGGYEASGGGTGHPFGRSGVGSWNDDREGGYGGGSGKKQKERGGLGAYATLGTSSRINDGRVHGSKTLVPLAGGSGGGSGNPQASLFTPHGCAGYGGGGGGAIAIYSKLNNHGYSVTARGYAGASAASGIGGDGGSGSGGGVIISSKLNTTINKIDVHGGNRGTDTAGLGYVRIEADTISNLSSDMPSAYYAIITDTSSYVGKNKNLVLTGRKNKDANCDLYIRNERNNWKFLATVYDEYWSYELTDSDFGYEGDTLFFITALQETNKRKQDIYESDPIFIMSQAGANILKVARSPYISKVRDLSLDTNIKNCAGTSVKLDVQVISDTGDAELIFWKNKISQKISWGKINISGDRVTTDAQENYIVPIKDSAKISVTYLIPENLLPGVYKDTLELWHNDSLRPNPWKIPVELKIESVATINLDSNLNHITELDLGSVCRGSGAIEKTFFVANPTNFSVELDDYYIYDNNNNNSNNNNNTSIEAIISNKVLNPNDTINISVRLINTEQPAGEKTVLLIKHYADCPGYADTIKIKYTIRETLLEYEVSEMDFGEVRVGSDTTLIVTLTNRSNYAVQIEKKSLSLVSGKDYYITGTYPELPTILGENSTIRISIRFAPTAVGTLLDSLVLKLEETKASCGFISKLPLFGVGSEFSLYANKYEIDFGITDCEPAKYDTIYIINKSNKSISLAGDARIIEDIPGTFKILNQPYNNFTVAAGDSVRYIISANFSVENTGEVITGKLLIHNDSIVISLKYEIDDPRISLFPEPVEFGVIQLGSSAKSRVIVENYGKLPKVITGFVANSTEVNYSFAPQTLVVPALDTASFEVVATPNLTANIGAFVDYFNITTSCFDYKNNIFSGEIIKSDIVAPSVNFGDVVVCEEVVKSAAIINSGATTIEVVDILGLEGSDANLFTIEIRDVVPKILLPKESFLVDVVFNPSGSTVGNKQAKLLLKIFADGQEQIVSVLLKANIHAGILSIPNKPDFGDVYASSNKKIEIELKNIGDLDFIIENIRLSDNTVGFYVDNSHINNYLLAPGEHINTNINFISEELGYKYDTLLVDISYKNCRDTARIPICANVIPNNEITIIIGRHIDLNPTTKNYKIPVYATVAPNSISDFKIDTLEIEFDRTLFFPTATTAGTLTIKDEIKQRTAIINNIYINNLISGDTTLLVELIGDVMLGESDSTSLLVKKVHYANTEKVSKINFNNGFLTINICRAGSDRLVSYSNEPSIKIKANPVVSVLEVECSVLELGHHALSLVAQNGTSITLKEWNVESNSTKNFQNLFSMDKYSAGMYYLVLTTPTDTYSVKFILSK